MEQSKEFNRSVVVMPNMAISLWQTQTQGGRAYERQNHSSICRQSRKDADIT